MKQLPEGFLWGGATADFQYEGGFNEGEEDFYHMTLKQMDQWKIQDIIHFKCLMEQF